MNCVDDCKYREMLDDVNADLQELKNENAKLKNNNNYLHEMLFESRQANEHLHAELKRHKSILRTRPNAMTALYDENAKLRELARMNWFIALNERDALRIHGVDPDDGAYITALDETIDKARATMRELGIEVD